LGGVLGLGSPTTAISPNNIPSLAQFAFTVEMYYSGWVFRGFFENMTINESANSFAVEYQMVFQSTQRRGYRLNQWGFQNSANNGASQYATPPSYSGTVSPPQGQ
jgi:hypothetical protein